MTTPNTYFLERPDWSSPIRVSRLYRTGIQKAIRSDEKRQAIFSFGRLGIRFNMTGLDYTEIAYIRRQIFKYQGGILAIPIWPDLLRIESDANSGQKNVTVSGTTYLWFQHIGMNIVLMDPDDPTSYEVGIVASVTSTVITLEENLVNTWEEGKEIVPVIFSRIGDGNSFQFFTDAKGNITIQAREAIAD